MYVGRKNLVYISTKTKLYVGSTQEFWELLTDTEKNKLVTTSRITEKKTGVYNGIF